jgi:hypothetical protein
LCLKRNLRQRPEARLNGGLSGHSGASGKAVVNGQAAMKETISALRRCKVQESTSMLIIMLAAAMTVVMLVATFVGLHQEAQRQKFEPSRIDRFGHRY